MKKKPKKKKKVKSCQIVQSSEGSKLDGSKDSKPENAETKNLPVNSEPTSIISGRKPKYNVFHDFTADDIDDPMFNDPYVDRKIYTVNGVCFGVEGYAGGYLLHAEGKQIYFDTIPELLDVLDDRIWVDTKGDTWLN